MQTVGFVGLGSQGGPMASRIVDAGFPLVVWARRPDSLAPFVVKGAKAAASLEELGAACDHIGVCVVDDLGVLEVCARLIPAMRAGTRLVIHSTIRPESCVQVAEDCSARSIALLDAPVSGGGHAAASGSLTVMCGGDTATLAAARPVLETFGKLIVHLGAVGAGQRAKLVNNALMAANMGTAYAALRAGESLGLSRAELSALLQHSSGRSFGLEVLARLPASGSFAHGALLLDKDIGLLNAVLAGDPYTQALRAAAESFLAVVRAIS